MKIKRKVILYFSPTGGTRLVSQCIARRLGKETELIDITTGRPELSFDADDFVAFAVPVYGGRIPAPVYERMKGIRGNNTPSAVMAVYGNRAVEDANLEMADLAEDCGFISIAAGEFITRHSVDLTYGCGRPDEDDLEVMDFFIHRLHDKLEKISAPERIEIPGSRPYVKYEGIPIKPAVKSSKCIGCGKCAQHCPVGAIDPKCPQKTDKTRCISCMGCVSVCPAFARYIPAPFRLAAHASLKKACALIRDSKYYI